jgi:hypothetical protein
VKIEVTLPRKTPHIHKTPSLSGDRTDSWIQISLPFAKPGSSVLQLPLAFAILLSVVFDLKRYLTSAIAKIYIQKPHIYNNCMSY